VKVVHHPYNKGYGAALKTGTRKSRGKYVLFIDGDGEHDPKNIPKLIKHRKTYDMVVGARKFRSSIPREIAIKIITSFANYVSEVKIPDLNCGFRLVKRDILMKYLVMTQILNKSSWKQAKLRIVGHGMWSVSKN